VFLSITPTSEENRAGRWVSLTLSAEEMPLVSGDYDISFAGYGTSKDMIVS
jgi:hypothetical protein